MPVFPPFPPPGFVTLANVYTVTGHFFASADPTSTWRTSFDVIYPVGQLPLPTDLALTQIRDFWTRQIRFEAVLDHYEVRPWSRGNVPFLAQGALFQVPVGQTGQKALPFAYASEGTFPLAKEVVAEFRKLPIGTGRPGRIFIRGLLDENDATAPTGMKWHIKTPGAVVNDVAAQVTVINSGLSQVMDPARPIHMVQVRWSRTNPAIAPISVDVVGLHYIGPTVNKPTRANKK